MITKYVKKEYSLYEEVYIDERNVLDVLKEMGKNSGKGVLKTFYDLKKEVIEHSNNNL